MNKEIEFKYSAQNISLEAFTKFCIKRKPKHDIVISGFDHFYENIQDKDSFYRLRMDDNGKELTFKRKTTTSDNYIRIEHNIPLFNTTREKIESYCRDVGYVYNMTLFKTCFIFAYDWYTLVYYICYDSGMHEIGRFIEIEMKEDYAWDDEDHAMHELISMERICKPLGISMNRRVKPSLYEMFKKELKIESR